MWGISWLLWWVNPDVCLQTIQMSSPSCNLLHHEISSNRFQHYRNHKVTKFWAEVLYIPPEAVKATVNTDNAPSHPNIKKLCSHNGDIKRLVLPSNTNAMIWPMDHGITVIIKMFYTHRRFLIERMVTTEQPRAEVHKAQIPGSPRWAYFVLWHLIFEGPLYWIFFLSPFWHPEFWGSS